jgi:cytochrome c oxidase subunit II
MKLPFAPEQASSMAQQVDALFLFAVSISFVAGVAIVAVLTWLGLRYRRNHRDEVGTAGHGSNLLEIVWSVIPGIIFIGLFFFGAKIYFENYRIPPDAVRYYVVGKQWMWKYQHPSGNREINDFHVPVNTPIELVVTSEDVIHSFFLPAMRIKRDAVPGRYSTTWFEATRTGTFDIFCAEYCGAEHSMMIGKLHVMEPHDYEQWLEAHEPAQSLATTGATLFEEKSCGTCHRSDSSARAPILDRLYGSQVALLGGDMVTADDSYIRESIMNPQAKVVAGYQPIMPTFQGQLREEEILELISYIQSLGKKDEAGDGTASPTSNEG